MKDRHVRRIFFVVNIKQCQIFILLWEQYSCSEASCWPELSVDKAQMASELLQLSYLCLVPRLAL